MSNEILTVKNLSFTYATAQNKILDNISFSVNKGDFVLLFGQSGCGKTTLLKHLKKNQEPFGEKTGECFFENEKIENLDDAIAATKIGYVGQNPNSQLVTDTVWHELAFGLENLGEDKEVIRRRVAEIAEYFGMAGWFRKKVNDLSGGQKQLLNLASVMVMRPKVLLLDEPTSQIDPLQSKKFLQTVSEINRDFGTTIILSEQRLGEVFCLANAYMLMHKGKINFTKDIKNIVDSSGAKYVEEAFPVALRLYKNLQFATENTIPKSVNEGRVWLEKNIDHFSKENDKDSEDFQEEVVIRCKRISFGYDKNEDVLKDFSVDISKSKVYALVGGNGAGKSTALKAMAGILKPYMGKIKSHGKVAYLPQNPEAVFSELTVYEELISLIKSEDDREDVEKIIKRFELENLKETNPYDLSGGEKERLAIAKVLMTKPEILLLDEPTKGLDAYFKNQIINMISDMKNMGLTIVIVSHDLDFCAKVSDYTGFLFDGKVITMQKTRQFFRDNAFYTTPTRRMTRGIISGCVLYEDVIRRATN